MTVLLVFGLFVVIATAHNITSLDVPRYGDPNEKATLVCHYVNGPDDPPLHSVKWYRGNHEIFRFTPEQTPPTRTFNTTLGEVTQGVCNLHSCAISVALPKTYNTRISFMCEVSTEGPRFAVVKQTKNLTVAVILKEDPVILGVPTSVQFGEEVILNCTTGPAMPPANIVWYIDGKQERIEPWMINNTQTSQPNKYGHRSSWRTLQLRVAAPRGSVSVRCDAVQPTWPPYLRSANVSLLVANSPSPYMYTSPHSSAMITEASVAVLAWCMTSVHIFSKYSALSEV